MLDDILSLVINGVINNTEESSQSSESLLNDVVKSLHSLERHCSYYEDLFIVRKIRETIEQQFNFNNCSSSDKLSLNPTQRRDAMKLLENVRQSIIADLRPEIVSLLTQPKLTVSPIKAPLKKKDFNGKKGKTFSFNFDELESFGVLGEIFEVWQGYSSSSVVTIREGLQRLLTFDTLDLIDHPQWPELIQYLTSFVTLRNNEEIDLLLLALCHRYLTAFHPLHGTPVNPVQLQDVLILTLNLLIKRIDSASTNSVDDGFQSSLQAMEEFIIATTTTRTSSSSFSSNNKSTLATLKLCKPWITCLTAVLKNSHDQVLVRLVYQFFSQFLSRRVIIYTNNNSNDNNNQKTSSVSCLWIVLYYFGKELLALCSAMPVYSSAIVTRQTGIYPSIADLFSMLNAHAQEITTMNQQRIMVLSALHACFILLFLTDVLNACPSAANLLSSHKDNSHNSSSSGEAMTTSNTFFPKLDIVPNSNKLFFYLHQNNVTISTPPSSSTNSCQIDVLSIRQSLLSLFLLSLGMDISVDYTTHIIHSLHDINLHLQLLAHLLTIDTSSVSRISSEQLILEMLVFYIAGNRNVTNIDTALCSSCVNTIVASLNTTASSSLTVGSRKTQPLDSCQLYLLNLGYYFMNNTAFTSTSTSSPSTAVNDPVEEIDISQQILDKIAEIIYYQRSFLDGDRNIHNLLLNYYLEVTDSLCKRHVYKNNFRFITAVLSVGFKQSDRSITDRVTLIAKELHRIGFPFDQAIANRLSELDVVNQEDDEENAL